MTEISDREPAFSGKLCNDTKKIVQLTFVQLFELRNRYFYRFMTKRIEPEPVEGFALNFSFIPSKR